MPVIGMLPHSVSFGLFSIVLACLLATPPSFADDLALQSLGLRARLSEKTLLGDEAPEDFKEYDLSANVALPWENYATSGWGMGTRLMASAGVNGSDTTGADFHMIEFRYRY